MASRWSVPRARVCQRSPWPVGARVCSRSCFSILHPCSCPKGPCSLRPSTRLDGMLMPKLCGGAGGRPVSQLWLRSR